MNPEEILYLTTYCYQIVIQLLPKLYFYAIDAGSLLIRMNFAQPNQMLPEWLLFSSVSGLFDLKIISN
jgi:hypothetical protein